MVSCPVCHESNPDNARACRRCNSDFGHPDYQHTILAPAVPSTMAGTAGAAGSRPAPAPLPGDVIGGRYQILQRLGQGGMGMVFKARDRELDRIIALKTIHPILASNAAVLRRFKQEILLARQIAHRNVIRIYDLGVAGSLRFITMEYVEGEDLKSRLHKHGRLPAEDAAALIRQICDGLQAAHAEDVIHRDLKPENVLIDAHGHVRIMDFGLARNDDVSITATGAILGTADYMSPEQARGERADVRSDVFSLGIIFYEMLTGELPFAADSAVAAMLKRTRERAPRVDSIDPAVPAYLTDIVARCLEPDPAARYQNVAQILQDLDDRDLRRTQPSSAPGVLPPGAMLGSRYRIEAHAGDGGMGCVYRASDLELNRAVALKVVRPELAADPHTLELLKQEILLASRVSHRHVLRIHDLGEAGGLRFISMAWVDGEDLEKLIARSGPLPEEQVRDLAVQLCEGLEAAHREGIVHRDLKPRNVLLDTAGNACISDFGLAQTSGMRGEIAGTPRYMSPEQAEGKPLDARTDIYSLGLVLYEMVTRDVPFSGDSALGTMVRRLVDTPKNPKLLNPAISDRLAAVILRCLERDPAHRYDSAREVLADLQRTDVVPAPPPSRSKRAYMIVAAAVLVVAAAIISWLVTRETSPAGAKYIAVLPFRTLRSDANLSSAAEGISDAIATRLFSLSSVHLTAAPEKSDLNQPLDAIARKLGANLVIDGTVQSVGDRLAVTVHITDPQTRRWLWGHNFAGGTGELLSIQDQICAEIIGALNVRPSAREMARVETRPTDNMAAYDLYLEGRRILKDRRDASGATAALDLFERASAKDPTFTLAWAGVTDASLQLYRIKKDSIWTDKAMVAAQQAHRLNASVPEVHFALGSVYTATGRHAEAVAELKDALKLAPNSDDGYCRLGRAYLAMGKSNDALDAFNRAVKTNPYYWSNHYQLGVAYLRLGRNREALSEFQRVIELDPSRASAYNNIGAIYERESRFEDSIPMFRKAIELQPYAGPYSNLGTAYFFLGRYQEAVPMFEKAVELSPNDEVAAGNLADAYRQSGQREKANAMYDRGISLAYKALEVNPQNAGALGSLGRYYARKGEPARGAEFVARARGINSADNELMYTEAVVDALSGRNADSLAALQRAIAAGYSLEEARRDPDLKSVRALPGFESAIRGVAATPKAGQDSGAAR